MFILSFALIGLDLFKCLVATGIVLIISVITYSWLGPFLPGDKYAGNAFYCYPLYYTACILLALSAGRSRSQIIQ